jgi:uncharacterized protein (DUF697 family)
MSSKRTEAPADGANAKKPSARKASTRKAAARETPARESPARKTAARKTAARKTAAREAPARETPARKAAARKAPAARKAQAREKASTRTPPQPSPSRKAPRGADELAQAEVRAREAVNRWMAGAAAVSWVPGSTLVIGAADFAMIRAVAKAFEVEEYDMEAVVGAVGASATGKLLAESLSFIPVAGWIAKAAIAGGITKAMGEAVIAYMRERSPLGS